MMDVMGRIIRGGRHPCPAWGGLPGDEFDHSSQGRVGEGQRTRRNSFIEAVNQRRVRDGGRVCAEMHGSNYCSISLGI